ncbi:O-antigen ligase family protein [Patescibacteria group bacterium]|nr:O-antigen ligase family protein [Patescibacteria group bacterium]
MKLVVTNMTWSLSRLRVWWAYVTLLILPLQTRLFWEGPSLGGFPWEQARFSIYLSWIFIATSVVLRVSSLIASHKRGERFLAPITLPRWPILLLLLVVFHTLSVRATSQSLGEWVVLGAFLWSVCDLLLSSRRIGLAYAAALVPSLVFGVVQFATQSIPPIKWLGIAAQLPSTLGVSVIETHGERILRAYGMFPHPNIFAGWLAVLFVLLLWLFVLGVTRWQRMMMLILSLCTLSVLFLTFSRTAILAAFIGSFLTILSRTWQVQWKAISRLERAGASVFFIGVSVFAFFSLKDLWIIRAIPQTRLEGVSVNERVQGIQDGISIFHQYPLLGVGPGAELFAIQALHPTQMVPPVPPHVVWLVLVNELGVVGIIALFLAIGLRRVRRGISWLLRDSIQRPLIATLLLLSCFDHYLWTLWSGKVLVVFLVFLFSFLQKEHPIPSEEEMG